MIKLLAFLLLSQSIELTAPESVEYAHKIRASVAVNGIQDWHTHLIVWNIEGDESLIDIDSNQLKANTVALKSIKIKVTVIFIYNNFSSKRVEAVKYVTVPGPPGPNEPSPGPNEPSPGPPEPSPGKEVFGLKTWCVEQLTKTNLDKTQAKALASSFTKVIELAKLNHYPDKASVISELASSNRVALRANVPNSEFQKWVTDFLEPLNLKINPLNPKIKTIADQIQVLTEIRDALVIWQN